MANRSTTLKEEDLRQAILLEKEKGTSDIEIGNKYGVNLKFIEKLITKSKGINISNFIKSKKIKTLHPKNFKEEQTTVWSFKQRGNWATHSGEYRGNWSPYIPRNVILRYSKPGETVLDYFCGAGTTAVEAKLLSRECIALDINDKAIDLAKANVNFRITSQQLKLMDDEVNLPVYEPQLSVGDARDLSFIQNNSIDLICAHPPYSNIVHYTDSKEGDLSFFEIDEFLPEMAKVAKESFRVLKPGRQCAILIGDMRKQKHVVPLGFKLIDIYLNAGFKLHELVIKRQHNCKTTGFWYANSIKYNFLLLAHEYLPIFEKPTKIDAVLVRETKTIYGKIEPVIEKPTIKKKLKEFETTTVWIFPGKDFEERLNKNVIERYWRGDGYKLIALSSIPGNRTPRLSEKKKIRNSLVYIKSPILGDTVSASEIESYMNEVEDIVQKELSSLNKKGSLVIETKDVRADDYLKPLARQIVDSLKHDNLRLKEIVVVTPEERESEIQTQSKYLKIIHQYLLVYEKGENKDA